MGCARRPRGSRAARVSHATIYLSYARTIYIRAAAGKNANGHALTWALGATPRHARTRPGMAIWHTILYTERDHVAALADHRLARCDALRTCGHGAVANTKKVRVLREQCAGTKGHGCARGEHVGLRRRGARGWGRVSC